MGVDDIDRRSFCPYILHRLGLPEDADSRDMLEEQLRVVVGRNAGTGAVADPVLYLQIKFVRRRVVDEK